MSRRELLPEETLAIDATSAAVADYAKIAVADRPTFGTYIKDNDLADGAEEYVKRGYLPSGSEKDPQDELQSLLEIAQSDVRAFYGGAYDFLGGQGYDRDDRLAIVQRSRPLAHSFGSRNSGQAQRLSNAAAGQPELLFQVGANREDLPVLTYTPEARELYVTPVQAKEFGCPALRATVTCPETEQSINVYDKYWEAFCEDAHEELVAAEAANIEL